jgi:prolyl-tRNA synthetase
VFHDGKGIIWPKSVAPFDVHLVGITNNELRIMDKAEEVYKKLQEAGLEVLYDDRDARAGEKFADADLIGIPVRLVVSDKTDNKIEIKRRDSSKVELLSLHELLRFLGD